MQCDTQTFYLSSKEFNLIEAGDAVDVITAYKSQCRNSKHWTVNPENAMTLAVNDVIAQEYDPSMGSDYLSKKKQQLTSLIGFLSDLAGFEALEVCTPIVGRNNEGGLTVSLVDDQRYTVAIQLQDHIGYEHYKNTFLEPFAVIDKSNLPFPNKVALYKQVKQIISETIDAIALGDSAIQIYNDRVAIPKQLLGLYDFNMGHSTFSDVFHYHLGNMAIYYCSVLHKLHMGQYVNGIFRTDYITKKFEPELGYIILLHCPDT